MASSPKFDPVTQDLVDDGAGSIVTTSTSETAVLHQVLCHLEEWWGDAEAGSRLHRLDLFASDPEVLIAAEARRALTVLEERGLITDLDVQAAETAAGRIEVRTSFRDVKTGSAVELAIPVGG